MAALRACPFCRKLFTAEETRTCPDCDVALVAMGQLPPSHDVLDDEAERGEIVLPEDRPLPTWYLGRGRGAMIAVALAGLVAFFLPWVELRMPDTAVYSAFDLARGRAGWLWGGATGWLVLIPLLLTRRTVTRMRGIRMVAVMFAAMTFTEVVMLLLLPPRRGLAPLDFSFRYGLYLSGALSLLGVAIAARFGGSLQNLPTFLTNLQAPDPSETSAGETLH